MFERMKILILGGGTMGSAFVERFIEAGMPSACLTLVDPKPLPARKERFASLGLSLRSSLGEDDLREVEILILAIKPQDFESLRGLDASHCLIISIAAGKRIDGIGRHFGDAKRIVRVMPNSPVAVGEGFSLLAASTDASEEDRRRALMLMQTCGPSLYCECEDELDLATAISGTGPAYFFRLCESLQRAAEKRGMRPEVAERAVRQTLIGSGALLASGALSASARRAAVSSRGGTTLAAMECLDSDDRLDGLLDEAVGAAQARAVALRS